MGEQVKVVEIESDEQFEKEIMQWGWYDELRQDDARERTNDLNAEINRGIIS